MSVCEKRPMSFWCYVFCIWKPCKINISRPSQIRFWWHNITPGITGLRNLPPATLVPRKSWTGWGGAAARSWWGWRGMPGMPWWTSQPTAQQCIPAAPGWTYSFAMSSPKATEPRRRMGVNPADQRTRRHWITMYPPPAMFLAPLCGRF